MSKTQYTYAVARIRALEVSLFSASVIEQLLACRDYDSCLRFLQEKGWGGDAAPDADRILAREEQKIWETVREMHVDLSVFNVLYYPNWFHNLKAAVKAVCTGRENGNIFYKETPVSGDEMMRIIKERDYRALPVNMQKAAEEAVETLLHSGDGQLCDIIIDRACMEAIREAGRLAEDSVIKDYAEETVAITNIKIGIRAARTAKSLEFMK